MLAIHSKLSFIKRMPHLNSIQFIYLPKTGDDSRVSIHANGHQFEPQLDGFALHIFHFFVVFVVVAYRNVIHSFIRSFGGRASANFSIFIDIIRFDIQRAYERQFNPFSMRCTYSLSALVYALHLLQIP